MNELTPSSGSPSVTTGPERGDEAGFALVSAIIVMMIVVGISLALITGADVQQRAAGRQGATESAFSLAEAALNAQIFELAAQWPTSSSGVTYPTACGAASAGVAYCPNGSGGNGGGSFGGGYSTSGSCPSGTPPDAWSGSAAVSNGWATYVRDDGGSTASLFASATNQTQLAYDANGNGVLWVRSVATVNCRTVTLVERVTRQVFQLNFPQEVVNANGFETSNNGNKLIVDTQGAAPQPSQVSVRCKPNLAGPGQGTACTNYGKSAQVSPGPTYANPPSPAQTLNAAQLAAVKSQAAANGTDFEGPGNCPGSITQLTGAPVYVNNCGDLSFTGNGQANSATSPGYMVLANGTIYLGGTTNYYGVIYDANGQAASGDLVTLHGNANVQGAITVDGNGTINFGSSGTNLVFDPGGFSKMQLSAGAIGTPNTFRELPQGQ